ncbi:MAG: hypothetical protein ACJZ40_05325 [Candidatus Poseidoniaceae archaeon]
MRETDNTAHQGSKTNAKWEQFQADHEKESLNLTPIDLIENKRHLIIALPASILPLLTGIALYYDLEVLEALPAIICLMSPLMLICALMAMVKLGSEFSNPFVIGTVLSLPISTWEYFNQAKNGCLSFGFPGSEGCPPDPPGYHLPRVAIFCFQTLILFYAYLALVEQRNWRRMYGLLYAAYFSFFVYLLAYVTGIW